MEIRTSSSVTYGTHRSFPTDPLSKWYVASPVIGAIALFIATAMFLYSAYEQQLKEKSWIPAAATITRAQYVPEKKGGHTLYTFNYQGPDGVSRNVEHRGATGLRDSVEILVNPTNNAQFMLASDNGSWKVLLIGSGVTAILMTLCFYFAAGNSRRRAMVYEILAARSFIPARITTVRSRRVRRRSGKQRNRMTIGGVTFGTGYQETISMQYQVVAHGISGSYEGRQFVSYMLDWDPGEIAGAEVQIAVDPRNPDHYYFGEESVAAAKPAGGIS